MVKKWGSEDDAKLIQIFRTPRNGVDPTKLDVASVKAVHSKFFPERKYNSFSSLYRGKARDFCTARTRDGHRKRSAEAKEATEEAKIEDISDDSESENEFLPGDEGDEELEADEDIEEDEVDMVATPARKKRTPRKASASKQARDDEDDVGELVASVSKMNVHGSVHGCFDVVFPFMLYSFMEGDDTILNVDFFAYNLPEKYFIPDVINKGWKLSLKTRVPLYFISPGRIIRENKKDPKFNKNTAEAQSFKSCCNALDVEHGGVGNDVMYGKKPQVITLPFRCEDTIKKIRALGSKNKAIDVERYGGQQWFQTLRIKLKKLNEKRRTEAEFELIESSDEEELGDATGGGEENEEY